MMNCLFNIVISLFSITCLCTAQAYAKEVPVGPKPPKTEVIIVGGGISGAFEAYYAHLAAQKRDRQIVVTVYDKSKPFKKSNRRDTKNALSNTAFNILPSLTADEILSVVPRGSELIEKLKLRFDQPGGIRVDDVAGVNDSPAAVRFKEAVGLYGKDPQHDDRTQTLLKLGKMSMDLWKKLYDEGDYNLKGILVESNFNPCCELPSGKEDMLHSGYRIDLLYGIPNVLFKAEGMKETYQNMGYSQCRILTPDEVVSIDPYLKDFCEQNSFADAANQRHWNNDCIGLWRPGGCIDATVFLPKFYEYLRQKMGTYTTDAGEIKDCFQIVFEKEVVGVVFDSQKPDLISAVKFADKSVKSSDPSFKEHRYVFCPGESVGTLNALGFQEPAYSAFAGPSLRLTVPISSADLQKYNRFGHCMEVHREGIVLAWQARVKDGCLFIGVAGTKAFYGDKSPTKDEAFATDRNLVQLNMINDVLPQVISLAVGQDTQGKKLTQQDLQSLEKQGVLQRWVGRRAVAYDGFPTLGALYAKERRVKNARCTTHLGSGGVSFAPAVVTVSRSADGRSHHPFYSRVLRYSDSRRTASVTE